MNQCVTNFKKPELAHDRERFNQPYFPQDPGKVIGIKFIDAGERHIAPGHPPAIDHIDDTQRFAMPMPLEDRPSAAADEQRPAMIRRPCPNLQRLHARRDQGRPGLFDGDCLHGPPSQSVSARL